MPSKACLLPERYTDQLKEMGLVELAMEAAHMRGDGTRPGTATSSILLWVRLHKAPGSRRYNRFLLFYGIAWETEKRLRDAKIRNRPTNRPVTSGGYNQRRLGRLAHR